MAKTKTSKRLASSSKSTSKKKAKKVTAQRKATKKAFSFDDMPIMKVKRGVKTLKDESLKNLRDAKKVREALVECLFTDDIEAFKEILRGHFDAISMTELSKGTGVPRRTLYRITEPDSNPTLKVLTKVLSELVA